jgi:hypothetical protein
LSIGGEDLLVLEQDSKLSAAAEDGKFRELFLSKNFSPDGCPLEASSRQAICFYVNYLHDVASCCNPSQKLSVLTPILTDL